MVLEVCPRGLRASASRGGKTRKCVSARIDFVQSRRSLDTTAVTIWRLGLRFEFGCFGFSIGCLGFFVFVDNYGRMKKEWVWKGDGVNHYFNWVWGMRIKAEKEKTIWIQRTKMKWNKQTSIRIVSKNKKVHRIQWAIHQLQMVFRRLWSSAFVLCLRLSSRDVRRETPSRMCSGGRDKQCAWDGTEAKMKRRYFIPLFIFV